MKSAPRRVLWTQGMLMSPQHLQQQDIFHESSREARLNRLMPDGWGVSHASFDHEALAHGRVAVRVLDATFASGLHVVYDTAGNEDAGPRRSLERQLENHQLPTQRALGVYVAVARLQNGAANAATEGPPLAHQRFVARRHLTAEQSQGATPAVEVSFAEPHLQLLFDGEIDSDVEALRIGELSCDTKGTIRWDWTFVPPCLRLGASDFVMHQLRRLLAQLVARQGQLAGQCRHRRGGTHPLQVEDVLHLTQLAAVRAALPWLRHLVDAPDTAPRLAALMLAQIVGQLSVLADDAGPAELPALQHRDLRGYFTAAFAALASLLDGAPLAQQAVALEVGADQVFRCTKLTAEMLDDADCLLAVRGTPKDLGQAERWVKSARVAAADELAHLIRAAAGGVPLTHLARPPHGVPWDPELLYLALETHHPRWQEVRRDGTLGVALPPHTSAQDLAIELLLVPRKTR